MESVAIGEIPSQTSKSYCDEWSDERVDYVKAISGFTVAVAKINGFRWLVFNLTNIDIRTLVRQNPKAYHGFLRPNGVYRRN